LTEVTRKVDTTRILVKRKVTYFIRQGKRGPIKIGTAFDPTDRLRNLQVSNPTRLYLLGLSMLGEYHHHELFKQERISGEWFKPSRRLIRYIQRNTFRAEFYVKGRVITELHLPEEEDTPSIVPLDQPSYTTRELFKQAMALQEPAKVVFDHNHSPDLFGPCRYCAKVKKST
jgi:hypothetical protein